MLFTHPQVRYALCDLVFRLEDETVVNFSKAVVRGNGQYLKWAGA